MTGRALASTHERAENSRPVRLRPPTHPGEVVREDMLPELRLSVAQAARREALTREMIERAVATVERARHQRPSAGWAQ